MSLPEIRTIAAPSCLVRSPKAAKGPRVIIIGGGFGGINVLRALRNAEADVVLIDKRNYHLFQPLLYQVATAGLNPAQIAAPLRKAVEVQPNSTIFLAEVTGIDMAQNRVLIGSQKSEYSYDYLVIAAGAQTNYFGKNEWNKFAPGLKSIEEAISIRRKFLLAFEQAEMIDDPLIRSEFLTFVVVGGGPTGVELAGAMAEIAHTTLKCSFRNFSAATARVILIDSGERLLKTFAEDCSKRAKADLEALGVEVILGARVNDISEKAVSLKLSDGEEISIATRQVTWAAGIKANPLGAALGVPLDTGGRVMVENDLSVPGYPNIFVIGDLASYVDPKLKRPVPGVAQGAIQMGKFVGQIIAQEIRSGTSPRQVARSKVFNYYDKGSMATIGRGRAVVEIGRWVFSGFLAWGMWAFVHVFFLIGFRNRLATIIQWVWTYFFFERGVRLITGDDEHYSSMLFPKDKRLAREDTMKKVQVNSNF